MRILLLENNRFHALLIKRELLEKYPQSTVADFRTAGAALEELKQNRYDVAVVDYDSNGCREMAFLNKVRKTDERLALILLAAADTDRLSERALRAGVSEFLIKENSFHLLIPHLIERLTDNSKNSTVPPISEETAAPEDRPDLVDLTVSTLSHEINNPLMTILGESELLLHNGYRLAPEVDRKLRIIEESALRIKTALARIASIRNPVVKRTVSGDLIDLKKS